MTHELLFSHANTQGELIMTENAQNHTFADLPGFEVTVTRPDPDGDTYSPDDVIIYIDTPPENFTGKIRVRLNDALLYEGNPETGTESVIWSSLDGYTIRQRKDEEAEKQTIFLAADGSWGDAQDIRFFDVSEEQIDKIVEASEIRPTDAIMDINVAL